LFFVVFGGVYVSLSSLKLISISISIDCAKGYRRGQRYTRAIPTYTYYFTKSHWQMLLSHEIPAYIRTDNSTLFQHPASVCQTRNKFLSSKRGKNRFFFSLLLCSNLILFNYYSRKDKTTRWNSHWFSCCRLSSSCLSNNSWEPSLEVWCGGHHLIISICRSHRTTITIN
jgi:hypothetical protein